MRYAKGSIALTQTHDYPLLRQILRSQFVTHSQLFELMRRCGYERNRRVFDWRLLRLVTHGFVARHQAPSVGAEPAYSISASGIAILQGSGECFVPLPTPRNPRHRELNVLHAIELNNIRLSLLRAGLEILWVAETEIRSRNEHTPSGFAKDYDALVTVAVDGGSARFALEYERTSKSRTDYEKIAQNLMRERAVERILYLVPNQDLLSFVARFFQGVGLPMFFGLAPAWHERLLDMPIISPHGERHSSLRQVLQ